MFFTWNTSTPRNDSKRKAVVVLVLVDMESVSALPSWHFWRSLQSLRAFFLWWSSLQLEDGRSLRKRCSKKIKKDSQTVSFHNDATISMTKTNIWLTIFHQPVPTLKQGHFRLVSVGWFPLLNYLLGWGHVTCDIAIIHPETWQTNCAVKMNWDLTTFSMVQPFQKVWELLSLADPFPACAIVTGLSEGFGSWKASVLWQRETWRLKHELKHATWYLVVPSATCNSCIAGDVLLQQRCQVFSSSQQAMLPSAPHFGWQHIFLGCEDSTLAPLQMANISLLWWPAGSGEFPFFWLFITSELDWKILKLFGSPATMWLFGHLT